MPVKLLYVLYFMLTGANFLLNQCINIMYLDVHFRIDFSYNVVAGYQAFQLHQTSIKESQFQDVYGNTVLESTLITTEPFGAVSAWSYSFDHYWQAGDISLIHQSTMCPKVPALTQQGSLLHGALWQMCVQMAAQCCVVSSECLQKCAILAFCVEKDALQLQGSTAYIHMHSAMTLGSSGEEDAVMAC